MPNNLARGFVYLLGMSAIVWAMFVLPIFWQQAAPHSVATKLLNNDSFKLQSLLYEAQQAEKAAQRPFCVPTALRSLAILRMFVLNRAIADSDRVLTTASFAPLENAVRETLTCAPADSFMWLTLFWLDSGKYGLDAKNTGYLRLSYVFGPNEGWIVWWRTRLAFLLFDRLPPDLSSEAVDDFVKLVDTGLFYSETAEIFKAASPAVQRRIIEQLKTVNLNTRQAFASALRDKDVDVDIPGVTGPARPWR
jgi:hypothetical protein